MPEVEDVIETDTEESTDAFPELRIARKLGNLMEKAEPGMRPFLVSWLITRYGGAQ